MSVVVTGGAGFVGSHLVDRLLSAGRNVIVIDDLSTGSLSNLEHAIPSGRATFVYADICDWDLSDIVAELELRSHRDPISAIYHLASPASPEAYGANPWGTLKVNGTATMRLLDAARHFGASFLFSSTSEVYGDPIVHPQPEHYAGNVNPVGPRACYDEGKRFGEAAVSVAAQNGVDARIVRLFNCYGPRMQLGDGRLLPSVFSALLAGRPIPIHGDGRQTRSMTYVDDAVSGILTVANDPTIGARPVNLGSEEELDVESIARAAAAAANRPFIAQFAAARPEDPKRRKPVIDRARALGWAPKTTLHEGLAATFAWYERAMAAAA